MALGDDLSDHIGNYGRVTNMDGAKILLDLLYNSDAPIGFDVETGYTGPDRPKGSLDVYFPYQFVVGFSITNTPAGSVDKNGKPNSWARYLPLRHDYGDNLDPEKTWELFKPLLEEKEIVCHNWVFEARNLGALDRKGHGPAIHLDWRKQHDSAIQSYVLSESQKHGLKELTSVHYNYDQAHINTLFEKDLTEKQLHSLRFNPLDISPAVIRYVCDDVTWALRLDADQRQRCIEERPKVYNLERQIQGILVEMADTGIEVDWKGLEEDFSRFDFFHQRSESFTRELFTEESGTDVTGLNFASPVQVRKLLFEDMGLHGTRMTKPNKKGEQSLSTDETALEALRHQSPAVDQLLKHRQVKKRGEWFQQWLDFRTSDDGRIHPGFNQIRVQSGRFASGEKDLTPNVQNITKKWWFSLIRRDYEQFPSGKDGDAAYEKHVTEVGSQGLEYWTGNARNFLIASPGYTLLSFDYQAAEMRVLAALAQEPHLLNAFEKDIDVHATAASLAFNVPLEQIDKDHPLRQRAKAVNFGLVYGQGVQGLADGLGISKEEAQKIMDQYFAAFSKVDQWFTTIRDQAHRDGYVESWLGRKSTLWDLQSANKAIRSKADRMAVNIPVQGGAADYCKIAMVRAKQALLSRDWWGTEVRMLMNQHDSLVFEVRNDLDMAEVIALLEPAVSFPLSVAGVGQFPEMKVDWEVGFRWGSVKKFTPEFTPEPEVSEVSEPTVPDLDLEFEDMRLYLMLDQSTTKQDLALILPFLREASGPLPVMLCKGADERTMALTVGKDDTLVSKINEYDFVKAVWR